jgi:NADPH2:quinone reductase
VGGGRGGARDHGGDRPLRVLRISGSDLELVERSTPRPVADQVVVEVAGAGLNRADLLQVAGRHPPPPGAPPDVAGLEFAGTIVAAGPDVSVLSEGESVFGILGGGGHATHVLTREMLCTRTPEVLDPVEAGGVPEAFLTAHDALFRAAGLGPGERVLIHGVGSGVGTAAVQLARAAGAATVATSRTPEKLDRARELGLHEGVLARDGMAEAIGDVDVVLDLVGGAYLETDVACCRTGGRIVVIGLLAGARAELDLGQVLRKRLSVIGTVLRARRDHEKAAATEAFGRGVVPLLARRVVRPVTSAVVPLERARDAYSLLASNATFGKVVLAPGG